jgi:PTH1 family peptidyl-tRNA hydrolase
LAIDRIAKTHKITSKPTHDKKSNAQIIAWDRNGEKILLVKPQTFMNDSGKSLHYFIDKEDYTSEGIIVIYDDLDLPLGKIKISFDRGNGGHNGIKSLEEALGSRDFIRIRIGISRTLDDGIVIKPNVLGNFDMKELETLQEVSKKVEQAIKSIITDGKEKAMTNFN